MFCIREKVLGVITIQQNEKPTQICKKYGLEALHHLQLWEKGVVKDSDYRNHRIFTLRCISYNLVPVSIKLKPSDSKLSIAAGKIIQRAERQLLHASTEQ